MSDSDKKKPNRRDFILTATTAAGAFGVGAAVWPLVDQMNPCLLYTSPSPRD